MFLLCNSIFRLSYCVFRVFYGVSLCFFLFYSVFAVAWDQGVRTVNSVNAEGIFSVVYVLENRLCVFLSF